MLSLKHHAKPGCFVFDDLAPLSGQVGGITTFLTSLVFYETDKVYDLSV